MANTIRIKRRSSGATGAPSSLASSELAFNEMDNTLYYGKGDSSGTATSIAAIGGDGAFVSLSGTQTITGTKTLSGAVTFSSTVALGSSATATTAAGSSNDTTVATTAFVTSKTSSFGSGSVTSVALSLPNIFTTSGSPVTTTGTLTATLASQTANFVFIAPNGSAGAPTFRSLVAVDIPTLTAAKISDFDTQVRLSRLDQMTAPTASVAFNSQKITGLLDPTSSQDAATKNYVDNSRLGIDFKDSVRAATTANIPAIAGGAPSTLDGVTLVAQDRILVKSQTTTSQNGIYRVSVLGSGLDGTWVRTTDADGLPSGELSSGAFVYVEEGTVNAQNQYVITTAGTITVGTTGITWGLFSGAGKITVGNGLTKTANNIDVTLGASSGLETTSGLALTATGVTAGTYRSVTVDAKGRVTGGTTPTTISGYGITDAQTSDATLTALAGVTVGADQIIYATGTDAFTVTSLTSTARSILDDTSTSAVRTTIGVAIGTDVQAYDATLAALAGVTTAADKLVYASGVDTFLTTDFTSTARTLLDDTSTSAMRTTLGVGIGTDVQAYDATLAALAGVTTAADKLIYASGVDTFLTTDLTSTARTLLDDSSTSAMRTTLGVAIGTDVQAYNAGLASIAGLTTLADRMIYTTASNTYAVTTLTSFGRSLVDDADSAGGRTTLGLGTMATQAASTVAITGGTIDGITFDGGTF